IPLLTPPDLEFCFGNPQNGMSMFDPYRFTLRRAYAEGTDPRLYVAPENAAVRTVIAQLGLGERYEYWLRGLGRIHEGGGRGGGRFGISATSTPSPANSFRLPTIRGRCGGTGSLCTTERPPAISFSTASSDTRILGACFPPISA